MKYAFYYIIMDHGSISCTYCSFYFLFYFLLTPQSNIFWRPTQSDELWVNIEKKPIKLFNEQLPSSHNFFLFWIWTRTNISQSDEKKDEINRSTAENSSILQLSLSNKQYE